MSKLKEMIKKWLAGLFNDQPIPKCLQKNITRFYLLGFGIMFVSIILMIVQFSLVLNLFGFLFGITFICCAVYLTQRYKTGHYEIIEGTCIDIESAVIEGVIGSVIGVDRSRNKGKKNRTYIIEMADGRVLRVKEVQNNDQVRKGKTVQIYINPGSLYEDQTKIYNYLAIDVVLNDQKNLSEQGI